MPVWQWKDIYIARQLPPLTIPVEPATQSVRKSYQLDGIEGAARLVVDRRSLAKLEDQGFVISSPGHWIHDLTAINMFPSLLSSFLRDSDSDRHEFRVHIGECLYGLWFTVEFVAPRRVIPESLAMHPWMGLRNYRAGCSGAPHDSDHLQNWTREGDNSRRHCSWRLEYHYSVTITVELWKWSGGRDVLLMHIDYKPDVSSE